MGGIEIPWLGYLLLSLAGIGGVYFFCSLIQEKNNQKKIHPKERTSGEKSQLIISNVLSIKQQEPTKRPPLLLMSIGCIAVFLVFSFAIFQTYLVIIGVIDIQLNIEWIIFYILFGVVPLYIFFDLLIFDRKHYRSGKSATAVDAKVIIKGEKTDVFNRCANILESMSMKLKIKKTPLLLKATFDKSNISMAFRTQKGNVEINILCDANWVTVKIGKGKNQKILNDIQEKIIEEFKTVQPNEQDPQLDIQVLSCTAIDWYPVKKSSDYFNISKCRLVITIKLIPIGKVKIEAIKMHLGRYSYDVENIPIMILEQEGTYELEFKVPNDIITSIFNDKVKMATSYLRVISEGKDWRSSSPTFSIGYEE